MLAVEINFCELQEWNLLDRLNGYTLDNLVPSFGLWETC